MAKGLLYLTLWAVQLVVIAALASPAWMQGQVEGEKAAVERYLGAETAQDLERRADALFRLIMVDSGIVRTVEAAFLPDPTKPTMGGQDIPVVFDFMRRSLRSFWFVVYQSLYRALLLAQWMPSLGVVLFASLVDGAGVRRINKVVMRYANPVRYRAGSRALVALLVVPLFYLTLPVNVSPIVIPAWFFLVSGAVILVMANAQHRI